MAGKLTRQDVQDILAILENSSFDELKIETDDFKIALRRNGAASPPIAETSAPARAESKPAPIIAAARAEPESVGEKLIAIPAPMFGAFFRSPKPGAEPYVAIGASVKADTIIGVIEVMKLMNPVLAGVAGEIIETLAADGETVEFGQTLMRVRPL